MYRNWKNITFGLLAVFTAVSCQVEPEVGILNATAYGDDSAPLKDVADFPIGTAVGYTPLMNEPAYGEIVQRDFDIATLEYHMKHGAIVQGNGTLNFSRADEILAKLGNKEVFGHTLAWHANQNAGYLRTFAGIVVPAAEELVLNGGFEQGSATAFSNWSVFNTGNPAGTSTITVGAGSNEVRTGTRSMKVVNPIGYPGNQWRVQVASDFINTVAGESYTFTYWVKAQAPGGSIRLSTGTEGGGSAQFQGDQAIGTNWQQVSWTIVANSPRTRVLFDMGQSANTYFIDDASFKVVVQAPGGAQIRSRVDQALRTFITGTVNKYKGRVKAWDVVNEPVTESGQLRTNANSPAPANASDWFVWSEYLGFDYILNAFKYAAEADPTAELYINDFNLESSPAKLTGLLDLVQRARAAGAKIDGIGTQMHISWRTSHAGIEQHFKRLAATGLKVRVSELDVRMVMSSPAGQPTDLLRAYQAEMYKFVVESYIRNVPPAQRAGIAVWGVNDANSWLYDGGKEFPLLFDNSYQKKPAYGAMLQALKNK